MVVEEKSRPNKTLYKIFLFTLKVVPYIIAIMYSIYTLVNLFSVNIDFLCYLYVCPILPWIFIYISSFVFQFCKYHRIPMYYILVNDLINTVDTYVHIPISNDSYFFFHCGIIGLFLTIYCINYKKCKH